MDYWIVTNKSYAVNMTASRVRTRGPISRLVVAATSLVVFAGCGSSTDSTTSTSPVLIAAASDLRPAFEEMAPLFTADTGIAVTFSFGSSGQLREQIVNGAPFDVFASANSEFVDDVIDAQRAQTDTKVVYARGRIVLWAASSEKVPRNIGELSTSRYSRIAIANPNHAPYGLAAKQALTSAGVWNAVSNRLVLGENISDTKKIIDSGNVDAGIIAMSLAIADGGTYVEIPEKLHAPLLQTAVVTTTGTQQAGGKKWLDFMMSTAGSRIMSKYGFVPPQTSSTTS